MMQFEIPLEKHFVNDSEGVCEIRKKLIRFNTEERTRQALIRYLIKDKGYPAELIVIEYPMARFVAGKSGRADLVVFDANGEPLLLIECKKENEPINDFVKEQILKYDKVLKAASIAIVSGNKVVFGVYDEREELFYLDEFPSFQTLLGGKFDNAYDALYEPFVKYPLNEETYDLFRANALIGGNTDKQFYPFLINYFNFILHEEDVLSFDNNEDIIDNGLKEVKFGNASGGSYPGIYRSFQMPDRKTTVSLSMNSSTKGEGHPENTILIVAIEKGKQSHNSLQLKIDERNIVIKDGTVSIFHDCKITIGKLGAAKKKDLHDFVNSRKPHLISGDKILLGSFDINREISSNIPETQNFFMNMINYALLRDEFREIKKEELF